VSPYMSNGNAPSYLNSHPSANAISLLVGVADGLAHLHSCWPSIAHGDVRGSNILVSPSGDALLADHGLVKLIHRGMMEAPHDSGSHAQPTNSFANVESIRWAAPEIVCKQEDLEKNLSARQERTIIAPWSRDQIQLSTGHDALLEVVTTMSDVWSFAMTIYEASASCVAYMMLRLTGLPM
jgi:serine/threonine protein kinase